ncbi:MAG: hypothetical protein H7A49_05635 [Akkermansiaceae bacterium]|nr:hypothetical protein [Akkermansiaceae bacterium]
MQSMVNEHPFQNLFESLGRLPLSHAESVNRQAYEVLYDILSVPLEKPGRCIMLRAPRAGHGKTHLLSRVQHHLGATHEFIPLHPAFGCQIDAATVIDDTLRRLLRPLPASGGLCVLDLLVRRLFALALQPLVSSGEVPCQDRDGALAALRTRPIETFDFHHPNAVTAHWAKENFEVLGQRLAIELAHRCGLPVREVAFWVDVMFRFAATPVENPTRMRSLADALQNDKIPAGTVMERLEALIGMMTLLMRVVLVADELEGFSSDESAALRLAAFLGALRQSVERIDVVLSLNQDIWESAFVPRLSGGLADRLSEVLVELKPLKEHEMVELLESRVPGLGRKVLDRVDRDSAGGHARGLIRAAGMAWLRATAADSKPSATIQAESAAAVVPTADPQANAPEIATPPVSPLADASPEEAPSAPQASVPPLESEPVGSRNETPVEAPGVSEPKDEAPPELPEAVLESSPVPAPAPAEEAPLPEAWPSPELDQEKPVPLESEPEQTEESESTAAPVSDQTSGFTFSTPEPKVEEVAPASPFEAKQDAFHASAPEVVHVPASEPSPFEAAPQAPSEAYGTASAASLVSAEFQAPSPPEESAPEQAPAKEFSVPPPMEESNVEPLPDTDRVDELLRKFRERYGRAGS